MEDKQNNVGIALEAQEGIHRYKVMHSITQERDFFF
jgi:hypothetical protein